MGIHAIPVKMLGKIPTYYITDTLQEDAGGGNVRIWNYARVNGVLVPQFECIVSSVKLVAVGKRLADLAQAVFDSELLRLPGDHVH
jgi:hypothetical protein